MDVLPRKANVVCNLGGGGAFKGGRRLHVVTVQNQHPQESVTSTSLKSMVVTSEYRVAFRIPNGTEQVRNVIAEPGRKRSMRVSYLLEFVSPCG